MLLDIDHSQLLLNAALQTGLPVWVGLSCCVSKYDNTIVGRNFRAEKEKSLIYDESIYIEQPKFILDDKKYLKNKNLSEILEAQEKSTQNIFRKKNIPFRSFNIKKKDENTLGELFCFCELETILLGHALKVNPLDQPSVELIKTETKRLLSKL